MQRQPEENKTGLVVGMALERAVPHYSTLLLKAWQIETKCTRPGLGGGVGCRLQKDRCELLTNCEGKWSHLSPGPLRRGHLSFDLRPLWNPVPGLHLLFLDTRFFS